MATFDSLPGLIEIVSKHDQRLVNHDFALRQIEAKLKELQVQQPAPRTITAEQLAKWDSEDPRDDCDELGPELFGHLADRINAFFAGKEK